MVFMSLSSTDHGFMSVNLQQTMVSCVFILDGPWFHIFIFDRLRFNVFILDGPWFYVCLSLTDHGFISLSLTDHGLMSLSWMDHGFMSVYLSQTIISCLFIFDL